MSEPIYLLTGIGGSHAHGLATDTSDEDRIGVFTWPTEDFFSLHKPAESIVRHEPQDEAYHEVQKFCLLASKCNPTILELLWLDRYEVESYEGRLLLNIRQSFLSAPYVLNAYMGYAESQFRKMMQAGDENARARSPKHARHMLRLAEQGQHLYATGELIVKVQDPDQYREWETYSTARLHDVWVDKWEKFVETDSPLPEQPDYDEINAVLREIRRDYLEGSPVKLESAPTEERQRVRVSGL